MGLYKSLEYDAIMTQQPDLPSMYGFTRYMAATECVPIQGIITIKNQESKSTKEKENT